MIILKKELKKKKTSFFHKFLIFYFISSLVIISVFFSFLFTLTAFKKKASYYLDLVSQAGRIEYIYIFNIGFKVVKNYFSNLDNINLEIQFDDVLKIEEHREKSIKLKTLGDSDLIPEVNSKLIYNNKRIDSSIRLKGERMIHFQDKKNSSYRVKLNKDNYIYGIKKFSLQKPRVRNYIYEWIYYEVVGDLNLIKPIYNFINLEINGSSQGLYVLEEAFGKELIERNNRRNGPIFGFNDDMVNYSTNFKINLDDPVLEVYNKNYWLNSENINLVTSASNKFRDFINGKRKLEDTFDINKFASLFAIIDLNYTYHTLSPGALKLYYNPINGLFEPIANDGQRSHPNFYDFNNRFNDNLLIEYENIWWVKKFFFKNENELNRNFYNLYLENLSKISSESYINKFIKKRKKNIEKFNSKIYSDFFFFANGFDFGPGLYYFKYDDLLHRSKVISNKINVLKSKVQVIDNGKNYVFKIFFNECLKCEPYRTYTNFEIKEIICSKDSSNIEISKYQINKSLNITKPTKLNYPKVNNLKNCNSFVIHDYVNKQNFSIEIDKTNSFFSSNDIYNSVNYLKYFNLDNRNLLLKENNILIKENLFIPKNYKVILKPNQKIQLLNNAFIFSRSPWIVKGKNNENIEISGTKENFGGGLIISDTEEKSVFNYVNFKYLTGMKPEFKNINGKILTTITQQNQKKLNSYKEQVSLKKKFNNQGYIILGSINFNNTNVELKNLNFEKISSEDALNIIGSNFIIENLSFKENKSDAIDIDFGSGKINNLLFEDIGNDGIDFSGSKAVLENIKFKSIGDKSISVGEKSNILIKNLSALNSFVGIACKDGSNVEVENINFYDVNIAFAAYNKKPAYKYGNILLKTKPNVINFKKKWISDKNSKIIFEDKDNSQKFKNKNILSIIYEKDLALFKS